MLCAVINHAGYFWLRPCENPVKKISQVFHRFSARSWGWLNMRVLGEAQYAADCLSTLLDCSHNPQLLYTVMDWI